ncbi:MAG: NAD+ synthase [Betaproteobacteria bacterium]|nr:NAD+ synthase [Betaproteobacteria bacterium]
MKLAAAQLNQRIADFEGNLERIVDAARAASAAGAALMLCPELALCGYPPEDLLLRPAFLARCEQSLDQLCIASRGLGLDLVLGLPRRSPAGLHNAAVWIRDGEILATYAKQALPNYDVFDEKRYFVPGASSCIVALHGVRCGVLICEDFWIDAPCVALQHAGAELVLVLNASPFHLNKQLQRVEVARQGLSRRGIAILSANQVGGQDELVFDGASFALDRAGALVAQARYLEPDLIVVDIEALGLVGKGAEALANPRLGGPALTRAPGCGGSGPARSSPMPGSFVHAPPPIAVEEAQVWDALVHGTRDYVVKNGFPGVIVGLSGGIDSAVTLAVAVDALGAARVRALMMPSEYTADISWIDSRDMVSRLGVRYDEVAIGGVFQGYRELLANEFAGLAEDATEENLQARIRGTILMALSNKHGLLVLTTSNKSESAVGYATLYGDMAGGFAVLKDVYKTMVYRIAAHRNQRSEVIPQRILERPPSAELRPGQTDQDSLPPYPVLDRIVELYMEGNRSRDDLLAEGIDRAAVDRVIRLMQISEYKRRQAAVGIRVTPRGWGRDWRYPITSAWR